MNSSKARKKVARNHEPDRLSEIYHAAAQIICEKGYDAMSMNDIAEAVGITKAGVYHYIDDKKGLLFAIMSYGMDLLETRVITPARAIADAEERLRAIITSHAQMIADGENAITIIVDEVAGLEPKRRRLIDERKRAYFDFLRGTLEQLKVEGKLKDVDTTVAAFSLFGMVLWLAYWYRAEGRLSGAQVAQELVKIALGGLLRSPTRHA
jgi:AcrR family transcriptional regulator